MNPFLTTIRLVFIMLLISCAPSEKKSDEKKLLIGGYDLASPEKFNLPQSLLEVSGIAFNHGMADTVYAVQDEEGKLFKIGWRAHHQTHTRFWKKGDFEDLAIMNEQAYVLKSNGTIYNFLLSESQFEEPETVNEFKKVLPKGEYEGLYGDEKSGRLYAICKNCPFDDSKKKVSGYIINPTDSVASTQEFSVSVEEIREIHGKVERGFRPSALSLNPVSGDWYILSAVNKLLVITDPKWKVKEVQSLPGSFLQPEGIAFDREGNLYISNEGDDFANGNILKFNRPADK